MSRRGVALLGTVGFLLASAAIGLLADVPAPASVTILHFNDIYEIDAVENGASGGLARVATVLDRLKKAGPPVIVTLGGDFLSPSAIGTARIDGEPLAGRQMVDVLNGIGLDWATLGNHEFDLPEAGFRARLAEAKFKVIVSNVTDGNGNLFEHTMRSAIVPVRSNGRTIRLGVFGLVLDFTKKPWIRYSPPIDAAREQIADLRGKTDAIIALTHLPLADDQALVEACPEIDLVLGGHEHENWMIRRGSGFTPIVKADANVRSVAIVTMAFGPGARPSVDAKFQVLDRTVPLQPRVQTQVRRWVTSAFDAFRREGFTPEDVVVTIPEPLDGRATTVRMRSGTLTTLIASAMLHEAKGADVAILNGGSIRIDDVLPAGPVRQYDMIRILPFGDKVVSAAIDGELLTQVLEIGLTNQGSGGFLHTAGVGREGSVWTVAGKPIDPGGRYVIATSEFMMTGGEARLEMLSRTNPRVSDVRVFRDIRQALMEELRARYGGSGFLGDRFQRVAGLARE